MSRTINSDGGVLKGLDYVQEFSQSRNRVTRMDETVTKSLLVGLAEDDLEEVLGAFSSRNFSAGETIVQVGDEGDELFLIVNGKVRVWTGSGPDVSERTLSVMGPGEHFGEASMLSRGKRTATVTALSYVETLVLDGDDYRRLLSKHPTLLENISRSLTRRLSAMNTELTTTKRHRRGLHSLAIVVDDPVGWSLASALVGQLRGSRVVQPVVISDQPLPLEIADVDADATVVTETDLAYSVASRTRGESIAVVIASGLASTAAAIKECERVVFAINAKGGFTGDVGKQALEIPEHRRPIVAFLYVESERQSRSPMLDPRIRCVPVSYDDAGSQSHLAKLDAAAVTRIVRALMGTRIGLALGGGGAKGLAHIGVLEVFAKRGIVFDSVAGTSAGAIIAAASAAGFEADEIRQFFNDEMIPPRIMASRPSLRQAFLFRMFRGGRFEKKLRRYIFDIQFDQLAYPLAITTVDIVSGKQKIRREGDLVNAVLQSINHPVFGSPIVQGNEMLVDGGVLINVPASVLREEGCDYVVSVDVGSSLSNEFGRDRHGNLKSAGYLSTLLRTMDIGRRHASELHRDESDLIIFPKTSEFRMEDFHAVEGLVDVGREAGEKHYAEVESLIQSADST